MRNTGLEEAQAGIKISGRNINKLRYADETTLTAESEEELKSLLMKVKEESEKCSWSSESTVQNNREPDCCTEEFGCCYAQVSGEPWEDF